MGKINTKYTQEYVESIYTERGCVLLGEYVGVHKPLKYICSCGKENSTNFDKFRKQKHGCRYCTKIGGYSQEEVVKAFQDRGCILTDIYKGCKIPMSYICSCGEESVITFDSFISGKNCKKCGIIKCSSASRYSFEYIQQFFLDHNCILLSPEYKNSKTHLDYICACGNQSKITFDDFHSGRRCSECCGERRSQTKKDRNNNPTSLQQQYIFNILGGEENYIMGNYLLDIAFPEEKIYLEYDGSGHALGVKMGFVSEEEFHKKEVKRNYFLLRRGWKEIRIISKKDKLPNEQGIKLILSSAKEILNSGRSYVIFDIDKSTIECQNCNSHYDFGELKRVRND